MTCKLLRHRPRRTLAVLPAAALACSLLLGACSTGTPRPVAHRTLDACELFDPQALAADTGWTLPRQGTPGAPVRDGLRLSSCTLEPERTTVDSTEDGYVSVELSPAAVTSRQLDQLATVTENEVPSSLESDARDELAAHWLLASDLDEARRLFGSEPDRLRLPRELAEGGAVAYAVPRHGAAWVLAGGRLVRIALVGERVDARLLGDVATDAARRLEEVSR